MEPIEQLKKLLEDNHISYGFLSRKCAARLPQIFWPADSITNRFIISVVQYDTLFPGKEDEAPLELMINYKSDTDFAKTLLPQNKLMSEGIFSGGLWTNLTAEEAFNCIKGFNDRAERKGMN